MKIVHGHDRVEALAWEGPVPRFQIDESRLDTRHAGKSLERDRIAIDRHDGVAATCKGKPLHRDAGGS